MKSASVRARRGRLAVLALLVSGAVIGSGAPSAGAANPVVYTNSSANACSSGQRIWLVSCTTAGEDSPKDSGNLGTANNIRLTALVTVDPVTNTVSNFLSDEQWNSTATTTRTASCDSKPATPSTFPRQRCDSTFIYNSSSGTGLSTTFCSTLKTNDKVLGIQARDSASQTSSQVTSTIRFTTATHHTGCTESPYLYSWDGAGPGFTCPGSPAISSGSGTNFAQSTTPGTSLRYCYTGDAPGGDEDFDGINWRWRNLRTGTIGSSGSSCPANGDNDVKGLTVTAPERGGWVLEAELKDTTSGSNCANNRAAGYWFPLGTVDVNSSSIPAPALSATRPNLNGNTTITLTPPTDPDSAAADPGGAQVIHWDLDENTGNGTSGFETDQIAGIGSRFTTNQTKTIDTTGMTPGLHTVRARVLDNGAIDAADSTRKTSSTTSVQYRVDSPPVLTVGPPTSFSTAINTNVAIPLSATDDDGDTRTYSVQSGPSHGTGSFTSTTGASTTYTYTPASNYVGTDSITFKVDDGFGGSDTEVVPITVGPPDTQITASPTLTGGKSNNRNPSFSYDAFGASPVSFECRLITPSNPSPSFGACDPSPKSYSNLVDGAHTFEVRSKATNGGQLDPSPAQFSWIIDATAPAVTIDNASRPANPTNSQTANFTWTADESGTFECRLDEGLSGDTGWVGCGSGTSGSQSYPMSSLTEGSHNFKVRSTDATANTSIPNANSSHTWVVDITKPVVTIDDASRPANPTNSQAANFTFSSTEAGTFECRLDDGLAGDTGWVGCGSGMNSSQSYTMSSLTEGNHSFKVRQTDAATNTSDLGASSTHTWTVDITKSQVTIDSGRPANPTNSQNATFNFSSTETGDFECRLDGSGSTGWVACGDDTNSGSKSYDSTSLTEGSHTFEVRQTDAAGNVSDVNANSTHTWVVDLTAPTIDIDTRPGDPTNATSANFTFSAVAPNPEAGDFECKLDTPSTTGTFADCGMNATSGSQTYAGLNEEGVYTFKVKSTDAAGNTSDEKTYSWTVDLTPPFTSITQKPTDSDPGTNPDRSKDPTPEFKFESDPGSTFQCRIDPPSGPPTAYAACNSGVYETPDLTGAGFGEGQYLFEVFATDTASNPGTAASHVWIFDTTAPVKTTLTGPTDPTNSSSATFNFTYGERGSFECKLDTDPYVACDAPGPALSGSTAYTGLSEGNHTFKVKSTDAAGNTSVESSYTWRTDYTPPSNTGLTGPNAITNSTAATFTFAFNEAGALKCKLDSGPVESCGSGTSGSKSYPGPLAQGSHTFTVTSTDAANNPSDPATHTWVIDTTPPTVNITGGPSGTVASDDASFPFTANDNPSPSSGTGPVATQCKLDSGPFLDCDSPVEYNDLDDGSHTVTVRGTDQAGNQHSAFRNWTVDTTPPETTITSDPGATNPSHEASFAFASNEPGSTFECSLDGAPFQSCDSPKEYGGLSDGEHNFRVRATDPVGNVDPTPDSHDWNIAQQVLGESSQGPKVIPRNDNPFVKAHGRFRVGKVECPKGTGPCEVTKKTGKVRVAGSSYTVRVVLDELIGDGKNVAMFVVLPPGARQPLYEAGTGLLTLKVIVVGENGVVTKVKKRIRLIGQDKSAV